MKTFKLTPIAKVLKGGNILGKKKESPKWQDIDGKNQSKYDWLIKPTGQIVVEYQEKKYDRFCTGFLIGNKQEFLTAGHCIGSDITQEYGIDKVRVSFTYQSNINSECEKLYKVDDLLETGSAKGVDYAVLKLKYKGINSKLEALTLETKGEGCDINTPVVIAQHPNGTKKKVATGYITGYQSKKGFFAHNVDTLGGSSGSPLCKQDNHKVIGVHVQGGTNENIALDIDKIAEVSDCVKKWQP